MLGQKLSVLKDLVNTLPKDGEIKRAVLPFLQELQELQDTAKETVQGTVSEDAGNEEWIAMPFLHNMIPDIRAKWNLADFMKRVSEPAFTEGNSCECRFFMSKNLLAKLWVMN